MLLLGLHGPAGSGKDTAFGSIERWAEGRGLTAARRAFADKLKISAMKALGVSPKMTDSDLIVLANELKLNGEIDVTIYSQNAHLSITGREFFQLYGTEAHRDVFGSDFWVDALLPLRGWEFNFATMIDYNHSLEPDIAVITDLRFPNEAQRIRALGGHIIQITRSGYGEDGHVSEVPLPAEMIDGTVANNGTIEQFETSINSYMTAEFHMRYVEQPDYDGDTT